MPLADKLRPENIHEMVGQKHLIGEGKVLRRILDTGKISNMILFGPPGVGKTTFANIVAKKTGKKLFKLNATTASTKDIGEVVKCLNTIEGYNGIVLFLDEIQNFNKRQQQSLLSYIESGEITLISSTTENPYFSIYNAILSRCLIFEFKPVSVDEMVEGLQRAVEKVTNNGKKISYSEKGLKRIAELSKGDVRKSINILEAIITINDGNEILIDEDSVGELVQESLVMDESKYYDWVSMLQKSIRGSDPDAAILALAVLLKAGRMEEVIRRLLVIASEDCGLAMGNMYSSFFGLMQSAKMVGMPEAKIILSHGVLMLATSPKSNSACTAIGSAMNDVETRDIGEVPIHLRDSHYAGAERLGIKGYKLPHNYENNYVDQEYMPDEMKGVTYYKVGTNKYEKASAEYWSKIKKKN